MNEKIAVTTETIIARTSGIIELALALRNNETSKSDINYFKSQLRFALNLIKELD